MPVISVCESRSELRLRLLSAIHELVGIHTQQTQAVIDQDPDFARFDLLLHAARERKDEAKYAYISHVESHHCEEE
jgi:hypothetical protein